MTPALAVLVGLLLIGAAVTLLYKGHGYWGWVLPLGAALGASWLAGTSSPNLLLALATALLLLALLFGLPPMRRALVTSCGDAARGADPPEDERHRAHRARGRHGVVGRGALLGQARLAASCSTSSRSRSPTRSARSSTARCEELCAHGRRLGGRTSAATCRREVWDFIKRERFFGMIIPEEYGGLGFSRDRALARSSRSSRSRSVTARGHRDGAELARPGRAAAPLRHRRAEAPLPAAARARRGDPVLRADRARKRARDAGGDAVATASSCRGTSRARRCSACASTGTSATSRSRRSRR